MAKLNELLAFEKVQLVREGLGYKVRSLDGTLIETESIPEDLPAASAASIDSQIRKCRAKIEDGDFDGAIVRAAIENQNLIAAAQAFNHACDISLFVVRDDGGRDLHCTRALTGVIENETMKTISDSTLSFRRARETGDLS